MRKHSHLILMFLSFFILGTFSGFLHGTDVNTDPTVLKWKIITSLHYIPSKGLLVLTDNDKLFWIYNIDTNNGEFADPSAEFTALGNDAVKIPVDAKLVDTFLGGATAWTVKDVVTEAAKTQTKANKKNLRQMVAAVGGGFIGYTGGYYIGRWRSSSREHAAIVDFLKDAKNYHEIEALSFGLLFKAKSQKFREDVVNTLVQNTKAQNDIALETQVDDLVNQKKERLAIIARYQKFIDLVSRARKQDYDYNNKDFAVLE